MTTETQLTPDKTFLRLTRTQYDSLITSAEERGRASATQSVAPVVTPPPPATPERAATTASEPTLTEEQKTAMNQVKAMQAAQSLEQVKVLQARAALHNEKDPKVIAAKIDEHVHAEAAKGRKITLAQAVHEIYQK